MAIFFKYHVFAISAVLLSTSVFVKSLPTSVLVDGKQQQNEQSSAALNKESHAAGIKPSPSSLEHVNPIIDDKAQPKLHPQKRGVKQSFYEPGIPDDLLFSNNIPVGAWDDPEEISPYAEFQDLEQDYPQYYSGPYPAPHHQRPFNNFQHIMSSDNLYDEPLALPVKHKYPTRFFDERRKRGVNKNIMRLKRDSTKLNSADMVALLSFLESNQRNRYDNSNSNINNNNINEDLNALEYPKPFYGPNGNFEVESDDDDDANSGEWWNEYIEPSVQYYGNSRGHFNDNLRKRLTSTVFPVKRFLVAKKKRSLNHHVSAEDGAVAAAAAKDLKKKSLFGIDFNRRHA